MDSSKGQNAMEDERVLVSLSGDNLTPNLLAVFPDPQGIGRDGTPVVQQFKISAPKLLGRARENLIRARRDKKTERRGRRRITVDAA